jgi:hypothetical protein
MNHMNELPKNLITDIANDAICDLWRLYIEMTEEQLANPAVIGLFSSLSASLLLIRQDATNNNNADLSVLS